MSNFRKLLMMVTVIAVILSTAVVIGAAGSDELSVTAKSVSGSELEVKLSNTSDYYLGNVNIKVSSDSGSVTSYGVSGTGKNGVDTIQSVAPDGSVSLFVKLASNNNGGGQIKPPANTTGKNPVNTTATKNPSNGDPTPVIPGVTDNTGDTDPADTTATGEGTDTTGTDKDSADTEKGTDKVDGTASAGESVISSVNDESESDKADGDSDASDSGDDDSSAVVWIVVGVAAALVAAGAVTFIVLKKKKNAAKNISSVIVLAVLLGVLASAGGEPMTASAADEVTTATPGSISKTFQLSTGGSVVVSAEYLIAPKPVVQELKNKRRAPSSSECNNQNTPMSSIVEGAGPLAGLDIYVGKNDFMFFGDAIKDYRGQTLLRDSRLKKIAQMMNDRDKWAKEHGIKLYLVIAPNKTTVYPDYIPSSVRPGMKTNADSVVEHLAANSTVEVIDLRAAVKNARSTYGDTLFYKYDTHWNNNGGFVAYSEMIRRISEDVPGVKVLKKNDFTITEKETYMKDMAWYLGHYSAYTDFGPVYTLKTGMTATMRVCGTYDWHGQFQYASKWSDGYSDALKVFSYENEFNKAAPSVYMYRDSFSLAMVHFVKDSFNKSSYNWSYDFDRTAVLNSGADVVIMEVVEAQLDAFSKARTFTGG